ncbi:MAG: glycoside hydrolase family 3 N-terminal domain-containing protein [Candidatus Dormibacteria bacterium]
MLIAILLGACARGAAAPSALPTWWPTTAPSSATAAASPEPGLPASTAVGQMLAVSFDGPTISAGLRHLILDDKVGTVLLFRPNFGDAAGLRTLCAQLEALGRQAGLPAPLLVTLDEEGGSVAQVSDGIPQLPAEESFGSVAPQTVRSEVAATASGLRQEGVGLDLAPVADLRTNPRDDVIGSRSFGPDPAVAAPRVAAYVAGLHDGGVGATLKHFPGLGGQAGDPHNSAVSDTESLAQWSATSEESFAAGVAAGADAVMTTSLVTPNLGSGDRPALLSRASVRLLRDDLGFGGVIVTDALVMAAVGEPLVEASVDAATAGNDLLLLGSGDTTLEDQVVAALRAAVTSGVLPLAQVEASAARVDALRSRYLSAAP